MASTKSITVEVPKVPGFAPRRRSRGGGGGGTFNVPGLPKKPIIKGVSNSNLVVGIGALAAGTVGLYWAQGQGLLPEWFPQLPVLPGFEGLFSAFSIGNVANITLQTYPNIVKPDSQVSITGVVEDASGNAVTAPKLYYYVYEELAPAGSTGRILKDHGVAGELTSNYNKTISTVNYRDGTYTVYVSDVPLAEDPGAPSAITTGSNLGGQNYPDESGFDATIS